MKHIKAKMKQRGIDEFMLDIAIKYGVIECNTDHITLSRKPLRKMISKLEQNLKTLRTMEHFDDITVVKSNKRG